MYLHFKTGPLAGYIKLDAENMNKEKEVYSLHMTQRQSCLQLDTLEVSTKSWEIAKKKVPFPLMLKEERS